MYRLFCRIPKGLEPVAGVFRQVLGNPDPWRMISISVLFSVYKTRDSRNKFFVSRCQWDRKLHLLGTPWGNLLCSAACYRWGDNIGQASWGCCQQQKGQVCNICLIFALIGDYCIIFLSTPTVGSWWQLMGMAASHCHSWWKDMVLRIFVSDTLNVMTKLMLVSYFLVCPHLTSWLYLK